jgi:hypothetical protein
MEEMKETKEMIVEGEHVRGHVSTSTHKPRKGLTVGQEEEKRVCEEVAKKESGCYEGGRKYDGSEVESVGKLGRIGMVKLLGQLLRVLFPFFNCQSTIHYLLRIFPIMSHP